MTTELARGNVDELTSRSILSTKRLFVFHQFTINILRLTTTIRANVSSWLKFLPEYEQNELSQVVSGLVLL